MESNWKNLSLEDLPNEEWIDLIGFDGMYQVSSLGRIKSVERYVSRPKGEMYVKPRILKQHKFLYKFSNKYKLTCGVCKDGKASKVYVPKVIFFSFNPNFDYTNEQNCVMHKDGNIENNQLSNLCLSSYSKVKKLMFKQEKLGNFMKKNKDKIEITNSILEKKCTVCNLVLKSDLFERGRSKCRKCKSKEQNLKYHANKKAL